jgi:hypothetical protein
MEIRERTIDEIKKLDSNSLMALYEIVLSMKKSRNGNREELSSTYLNVRDLLKSVGGSLAEDIVVGREDRL